MSPPPVPRVGVWVSALALVALAGCTGVADQAGPTTSGSSDGSTTTEATTTTTTPPDGPYAPDPDPPVGPLPSFNEPAGREVTVWVHEAVLPALEAAIANLEAEEAAGNFYEIRWGDVSSFRPETVWPKRYLSFHAVGAAIDITASANPYRAD